MSSHIVSVLSAVLACCLVSAAELQAEDNVVVTENSLQDLTVRTKSSPEKTPLVSMSDFELKDILTEDIKRKIDDLKELKSAYRKVEVDFFGSDVKSEDLLSTSDRSDSKLLTKAKALIDGVSLENSDNESFRFAREYNPYFQQQNQYQNQNYGSKGVFSNDADYNGNYESISSPRIHTYDYSDNPYIGSQYNPSARTFGVTGVKGGFQAEFQGDAQVKPVHSEGIKPVQGGLLPVPVHSSPIVVNLHPTHSAPPVVEPYKPLVIAEHKPHEVYAHPVNPHEVKTPLFYEKKEIGLPGKFFSKQIILGPSGDFGSSLPHTPSASGSFPYGESSYPYYAPAYLPSSYPQGYGYGVPYSASASPNSWYPTRSYLSSYPEAQNYPSSYYQGQSYYPSFAADGYSSRSNAEALPKDKSYQDELVSSVSQGCRSDLAAREESSLGQGSLAPIDQLNEDIEKQEKKIVTLQDMTHDHSDSFIVWLNEEVNNLYSRWLSLKDDINTKKDQQPTQEPKTDELKF